MSSTTSILVLFSLGVFLLHMLVNSRYGFHRDELLTINNARNLAWGYVIYPTLTAFVGRVELELFGTSLRGFRFFVALSEGFVVLLAGLAARELGGKREAPFAAALAVAIQGPSLFAGSFMSSSSFAYLWWVLVAYFLICLLKSEDPRWWVAIGGAIGVGMRTKYTMAFLVLSVAGGLLLTPNRRWLKSPWLWCGVVIASLMMLPNIVWQMQHQFVSLECMKTIPTRDLARGSTNYFLVNRFGRAPKSSPCRYGARGFGTCLQPLRASATACRAGCI